MADHNHTAPRPGLPIDPLDRTDSEVGAALYEEYIALLFPHAEEADE